MFLLVDRNSIDDANDLFVTGRFRPGIKLNEYFDSYTIHSPIYRRLIHDRRGLRYQSIKSHCCNSQH